MNPIVRQCVVGLMVAAGVGLAPPARAEMCGTMMQTTLVAGQHFAAGQIFVYNDDQNLYVSYQTTMPWLMSEAHVAAATTFAGIPQTRGGNPMPGRFAYSATFDPEVSAHVFAMPLSLFAGASDLFVAAHAAVNAPADQGGSQTGWGHGPHFPGRNWAMYMHYTIQSCNGGSGGNS